MFCQSLIKGSEYVFQVNRTGSGRRAGERGAMKGERKRKEDTENQKWPKNGNCRISTEAT